MIVKRNFNIHYIGGVDNEWRYEVSRSEGNEKEIVIKSKLSHTKGKTKEYTYQTNKGDEEISGFFNKKFDEYQEKLNKAGFLKKALLITKFEKELKMYFEQTGV